MAATPQDLLSGLGGLLTGRCLQEDLCLKAITPPPLLSAGVILQMLTAHPRSPAIHYFSDTGMAAAYQYLLA